MSRSKTSASDPGAEGLAERLPCFGLNPLPGSCLYVDLLRHIEIGIVVVDLESSRLVLMNESAARVLELMEADTGFHAVEQLLAGSSETAEQSEGPAQRMTRVGSRLIGFTMQQLPDGKIVLFLRDVTEKLRLEAVARTASHMDNIGYIFSGIRHEIGNPLNSLKMTLSVLEKNMETFPQESVREYIERALSEVARMEYLLRGLKNFNMFEKPRPQRLDLEAFFELFLSLVKKDLGDKGVQINIQIEPDAAVVVADPRALQHVMLNLINNAADALENRIMSEIKVAAVRTGDRITITIEDEGWGIPAGHQEHVFKPFFTSKPNGSGLGLVIVKKLLLEMDGDVEISSREGVGTRVTVSLVSAPAEGGGR